MFFYVLIVAYWWALAINMVIQSCVLGTLVYKTNWEDQCRQVIALKLQKLFIKSNRKTRDDPLKC